MPCGRWGLVRCGCCGRRGVVPTPRSYRGVNIHRACVPGNGSHMMMSLLCLLSAPSIVKPSFVCKDSPARALPFCDASLPIPERVRDLLQRLNTSQRIAQSMPQDAPHTTASRSSHHQSPSALHALHLRIWPCSQPRWSAPRCRNWRWRVSTTAAKRCTGSGRLALLTMPPPVAPIGLRVRHSSHRPSPSAPRSTGASGGRWATSHPPKRVLCTRTTLPSHAPYIKARLTVTHP